MANERSENNIGTLNESPLHADLKKYYAKPDDRFEVMVDGYVVDIIRDDLLIEIQTRNLFAMKKKLKKLSIDHEILLVHPIPQKKWIIKQDNRGKTLSRRKSPKEGDYLEIFYEMVNFPKLLDLEKIKLELLLLEEEEIRRYDKRKSWRRKGWYTYERRLVKVSERKMFERSEDLVQLIPATLKEPFTTRDLAENTGQTLNKAQKTAYCLNKMGVTKRTGKNGNSILYKFKY